jgi:hypothetical protein
VEQVAIGAVVLVVIEAEARAGIVPGVPASTQVEALAWAGEQVAPQAVDAVAAPAAVQVGIEAEPDDSAAAQDVAAVEQGEPEAAVVG